MDVGLLIARVVFGLLLAAHGCQKLFGWFGGPGMSKAATFFESLALTLVACSWGAQRLWNVAAGFSRSAFFSLPRPRLLSPP